MSDEQAKAAKIRVLVLFGAIPLLGQERANIRVINAVRESGIHARFLTRQRFGDEAIEPELDRLGLEWRKVPFGPNLRRMGLADLWRLFTGIFITNFKVWRQVREYRPTHLYVMNPLYVFYTMPYVFLNRLPLIYRIGDAPTQHNFMWRTLWRWITRRITMLVPNADFVKRKCLESGVPEQKMRHVYSAAPQSFSDAVADGTDEARLQVSRYENANDGGETRTEIIVRRESDALTILYCGQIREHKGVGVLVNCALKLIVEGKQLRVLLAGDYSWNNEFAKELIEKVKIAGHSKSIQFLGYVHNAEQLWRVADIHVCPSCWEEPLANCVLEAKMAGVPSIVFPNGGLPETIDHQQNGWLCEEASESALETAVRHYLGQRDDLRSHGAEAKKSADGKFGQATFVKNWTQVFTDTLRAG